MKKASETMFLGTKLKELREKKGLNHQGLALELYAKQGLRVAHNTLRNWEEGNTEPDASSLNILATFFSVPLGVFFNGESLT
jgi:transcriptional regulator with XRE-family HTH domain